MLKTIQQKLHEASILDDKEPILSFIQVLDLAKLPQNQFKKFTQEELASLLSSGKVYYLLASSEKICCFIFQVLKKFLHVFFFSLKSKSK
jgi:hypothetical protein